MNKLFIPIAIHKYITAESVKSYCTITMKFKIMLDIDIEINAIIYFLN